jgi:membrane-associated protease RseP (regulator of RpoE activity)
MRAMRGAAIMLLASLSSCSPGSDDRLRLVTVHSVDTGFSLRELPRETLRSLSLPYGLAVVRTGAVAERAGLRIGDVVYGLNDKQVKSLEEFNRLLGQQPGGKLSLLIRRGGNDFYVSVDLAGGAPQPMPKGLQAPRDTLLRT